MKNGIYILIAICFTILSCNSNNVSEPKLTEAELDSINLLRCDNLVINETDTTKYSDLLPIPKNLNECFQRLDKITSLQRKKWIRCLTEVQFKAKMHFGFGIGLRNNWGLWGNSELAQYFFDIGIFHPDDMSGIILTSYYRKLNNQPVELQEQVDYYQKYWTDMGENVDSILELAKNENTWSNKM